MSLERCTIGLIEDDLIMGESLLQRLSIEGASVVWWKTKEEAVAGLLKHKPRAVICDLRLPDGSGEEVFAEVCRNEHAPPFLFMTAFAEIDQAVRLMRSGAGDYVTKPFEMEPFLERLQRIARADEMQAGGALGVSHAMREIERTLHRLAKVDAPLLITGETGSGKEVCARFLHALRGRESGPFMAVNCAAIPAELMESELFGHEKGAFTGAQTRHLGYAERAGRGTLFLDEIGDLAPKLQAKLLRLLEQRSFSRVGGEQLHAFQARIVCATNASLTHSVKEGRFREDLLYRINVVAIQIPPLRERLDDISWLLDRFFGELSERQASTLKGISAPAVEAALTHSWPGNVRELRNRIERAFALCDGPHIMAGDLFPDHAASSRAIVLENLDQVRDEAERRHIMRSLAQNDGAILATARSLGISRTTLWEKMKRLDIAAGDPSP
jgi:DNA-binding NtrC family response regulator